MNKDRLFLARCVIETVSPMAVHSGGRETGFDTQLARDWNSLPYIPATSIAGVWRSVLPADMADRWFGPENSSGKTSVIALSDAMILNSEHGYCHGLAGVEELEDPLYQMYSEEKSEIRERCRISHRGVASKEGKFDTAVLPSGIRFVFDIRAELNGDPEENELRRLISLFTDGSITVGSGITNGQGQISLVGYTEKVLKLKGADTGSLPGSIRDFLNPGNVPVQVDSILKKAAEERRKQGGSGGKVLLARLHLRGRDSWRTGNLTDDNNQTCCYREKHITWNRGKMTGVPQERILILGSTIKGIIAHRTDYHLRRLKRQQDGGEPCTSILPAREICLSPELEDIFGTAGSDEAPARCGNLIVSDALVEYPSELQRTHVKIDRFSGGAFEGALFSEKRLYRPRITVEIWLRKSLKSPLVGEALSRTITDILEGFLPISSGSGRQAGILEEDGEAEEKSIFRRELLEEGGQS